MTYTISSIDGRFPATLDELELGVGTDWSDDKPIPVFLGIEPAGEIDPATGEFAPL